MKSYRNPIRSRLVLSSPSIFQGLCNVKHREGKMSTKSPKSNHIQGKVQDPKAVGSAFKSLAKNWLAELLRHWMMRRTMAHLRVWRRHSGVSRSGARRRLGKSFFGQEKHQCKTAQFCFLRGFEPTCVTS